MDLNKIKGMKGISSLLERYKGVKIRKATTLFDIEPEWSKLREKRCPICGSLLKFPQGKKIAICYGKRHGDKKAFIIKNETLDKLK